MAWTAFGFPLATAKPIDLLIAKKFGRLVSKVGGYAFYEYKGKIYLTDGRDGVEE